MIVYFSDRKMNILGQASTRLPDGLVIVDDIKTEDIESGVASFEFNIRCDKENFDDVRSCLAVGNYVLRSRDDENEFYTIIETETDTREQEIYVYAEDAGLDLLNEIVGAYDADKAYNIAYYINKFTFDSGFVIGINEASDLTRKLSWDDEQTAAERVRSIATQFDCEISYSFDIDGLYVTKKYINIYRRRGNDNGVHLRLNKEIDRIVTKESIANIATALSVTGGTPDGSDTPITLSGYTYDDGDFYVQGRLLKCRSALQKWSRYIWADEPDKTTTEGQIVRTYSYDTTSQAELLQHALAELKRVSEIERNYEVDVTNLPDDAKIGDRVNVIDSTGGLFVSARILKLESSDTRQENKVTLGEYLIKDNGISQRLSDMADEFAKTAATSERAKTLANAANATALAAQATADTANSAANNAAKTATNYMHFDASNGLDVGYTDTAAKTNISGSGVKIYAADNTNHADINSDGMQVFKSGSQVASFGEDVVLGNTTSESRVVLDNDGVDTYVRVPAYGIDPNNSSSIGLVGYCLLSSDGFQGINNGTYTSSGKSEYIKILPHANVEIIGGMGIPYYGAALQTNGHILLDTGADIRFGNTGDPTVRMTSDGIWAKPPNNGGEKSITYRGCGYSSSTKTVGLTIPFPHAEMYDWFTVTATTFRVFYNGSRYGVDGADSNSPTFSNIEAFGDCITMDATGTFKSGSNTLVSNQAVGIYAIMKVTAGVTVSGRDTGLRPLISLD